MPEPSPTSDATPECGGVVTSEDGRELVLRSARVRAQAGGGVAGVRLVQRFVNPHADPLEIRYLMPLPADAAVGGFRFTVDGEVVVGQIDTLRRARERYEAAILDGHTAGMLEERRSSLFDQRIGNVPPHAEVIVELELDQPLNWLSDGQWEWRFPTVVAPRYMGEAGRVCDATRVQPDIDPDLGGGAPSMNFDLEVREPGLELRGAESPSHVLSGQVEGETMRVSFAPQVRAGLDRDLVVRWSVEPAASLAQIAAQIAVQPRGEDREHRYGLLTLTPPEPEGREAIARDVIVLLDTSGSMSGEPLKQARRVIGALIDTLRERDRLRMIAFARRPETWRPSSVAMNAHWRSEAREWLRALRAGGGTEMRSGIMEALRSAERGHQGQILLVTDGQIGFEREIVAAIGRDLPAHARVHTVGIGHSVNRSLTQAAARAGRGIEVIVAPGEDAERAAKRIVANTDVPVVQELRISGTGLAEPVSSRLPDLHGGAPVVIPLALDTRGGDIEVRGRTRDGEYRARLELPAAGAEAHGEAQVAYERLYARDRVETLEHERAAGADVPDIDAQIEALGLRFGISTRLTSWIAVSDGAKVDLRDPSRHHDVPQSPPAGMSLTAMGIRRGRTRAAYDARAVSFGHPEELSMSAMAPAPPIDDPSVFASAPAPLGAPPVPASGGASGFARMRRRLRDATSRVRGRPAARGGRDEGVERRAGGLVGRVLRFGSGFAIIEFEIDRPLDWQVLLAELFMLGRAPQTVELDESKTTRPGPVLPGQRLRVALRWSACDLAIADGDVPRGLHLQLGSGDRLHITLEQA